MQNLSLKELRQITKNRNTNSYKSISKDKLLIIIIIIIIIIIRKTEKLFSNQKKVFTNQQEIVFLN